MSKKSVRSFGPLRAVLLILLVLAVVLLGLYGFLRYRMNRLAEGAAFRLEYTVQSTADTPTSAYNTFQTMKGLTGTVEGQSQTDRFTARLYAQGQTEAFLEVYSGQGETLVNIGRLYRYYVAGLAQEYPLLASLIPDWGLGDYISQQQLARFFDQEAAPQAGFTAQELVPFSYDAGRSGYLYFAPEGADEENPSLLIGISAASLFSDPVEVHVLLNDAADGLRFELSGTVTAQEVSIPAPASRMADEDADALRAVWQALRDLLAFFRDQTAGAPVETKAA